MADTTKHELRKCAFCGRNERELAFLVPALDGVTYICNNCVDLYADFIGQHTISTEKEAGVFDVSVEPKDMSSDIREKLFYLFADAKMIILSFRKKEETLEDIFVNVTNAEVVTEADNSEMPEDIGFILKTKNFFSKMRKEKNSEENKREE